MNSEKPPLRPLPDVEFVPDATIHIPQYGKTWQLFVDVMAGPNNPNGIKDGFILASATPMVEGQTFAEIGEAYSRQRGTVDPHAFFLANMKIAETSYVDVPDAPPGMSIHEYGDFMATTGLRRSMKEEGNTLGTPHPANVPGTRFGFQFPGDNAAVLRGQVARGDYNHALDTMDNEAYFNLRYGFTPNMNIKTSLGRAQLTSLSYSVEALASVYGQEVYAHYQKVLLRHISFLFAGEDKLANAPAGTAHRRVVKMPDGKTGLRYFDDSPVDYKTMQGLRVEMMAHDLERVERMLHGLSPEEKQITFYRHMKSIMAACESTQDFASKFYADYHNIETIRTIDIVSIDLMANAVHLLRTTAHSLEVTGDYTQAQKMYAKAEELASTIRTYGYREIDDRHAVVNDVLFDGTPTEALNATMVYPLLAGNIFTYEQNVKIARTWQEKLLTNNGLRMSTAFDSPDHWDGHQSWPSVNMWTTDAFVNAATEAKIAGRDPKLFLEIAETIMRGNQNSITSWFEKHRNFPERINTLAPTVFVAKGEYATPAGGTDEDAAPQKGFGMTIGAYRALDGRNLAGESSFPTDFSWRRAEYSRIGSRVVRSVL